MVTILLLASLMRIITNLMARNPRDRVLHHGHLTAVRTRTRPAEPSDRSVRPIDAAPRGTSRFRLHVLTWGHCHSFTVSGAGFEPTGPALAGAFTVAATTGHASASTPPPPATLLTRTTSPLQRYRCPARRALLPPGIGRRSMRTETAANQQAEPHGASAGPTRGRVAESPHPRVEVRAPLVLRPTRRRGDASGRHGHAGLHDGCCCR